MNDKRYKWALYAIVAVILVMIGIQVYWNFKNYSTNKQQLINDVQISLDKAVDDYYTNLAQETTLGLSLYGERQRNILDEGGLLDQITAQIDGSENRINTLEFDTDSLEGVTILRGFSADSMMRQHRTENRPISTDSFARQVSILRQENDSVGVSDFEFFTSKVFISISNDSLDMKKIDSLVKIELSRKNIDVDYNIHYLNVQDSVNKVKAIKDFFIDKKADRNSSFLTTFTKSTLLPQDCQLGITFSNQTKIVLQRILGGILISTLLVLSVIACLFYLLKVIKHQKQLAEVKNDLISNITHEFKTPIATIGVALESIKDFNTIDDKEKTKTYLDMSSQQLSKLNLMVEKLLETATLDSDNLELNKETINVSDILESLISKYNFNETSKDISSSIAANLTAKVDAFHFENAINNIIDNAIKYGGEKISLSASKKNNNLEILISDNGASLDASNKEKIFEKFYRVPQGNTHDVKGFGIGLYYTKTIVEKHNGSIRLDLGNKLTTFKITIPNDQ